SSLDTPAAGQRPSSFVLGPSWETDKFSIRANYVQQSASYLPLLGLFAGDRKGPYTEGHYRPYNWIDLYGSTTVYSNNLEANPDIPTFHSRGYSTGASLTLPFKFNFSGSLSSIGLTQKDSTAGETPSKNRQTNISLSRPIGRHNPRISIIDLALNTNGQQ